MFRMLRGLLVRINRLLYRIRLLVALLVLMAAVWLFLRVEGPRPEPNYNGLEMSIATDGEETFEQVTIDVAPGWEDNPFDEATLFFKICPGKREGVMRISYPGVSWGAEGSSQQKVDRIEYEFDSETDCILEATASRLVHTSGYAQRTLTIPIGWPSSFLPPYSEPYCTADKLLCSPRINRWVVQVPASLSVDSGLTRPPFDAIVPSPFREARFTSYVWYFAPFGQGYHGVSSIRLVVTDEAKQRQRSFLLLLNGILFAVAAEAFWDIFFSGAKGQRPYD